MNRCENIHYICCCRSSVLGLFMTFCELQKLQNTVQWTLLKIQCGQ